MDAFIITPRSFRVNRLPITNRAGNKSNSEILVATGTLNKPIVFSKMIERMLKKTTILCISSHMVLFGLSNKTMMLSMYVINIK